MMAETAFHLVLENLTKLITFNGDLIPSKRDRFISIYEGLEFLRNFLRDWEGKHYECEKVKQLARQITDVANKAEDAVELFIIKKGMGSIGLRYPCLNLAKWKKKTGKIDLVIDPSLSLGRVNEEIKVVKTAVLNFQKKEKGEKMKDKGMAKRVGHVIISFLNLDSSRKKFEAVRREVEKISNKNSPDKRDVQYGESSNTAREEDIVMGFDNEAMMRKHGEYSSRYLSTANKVGEEEIMVGFDEEITMIKDQLTGGEKQLEIVSIVGMPGLGKTTLAQKVYHDPLIVYHFFIRAWICVSQEYRKQDLLRSLLTSVSQHTIDICGLSDDILAEELRKCLKSKRYLVVMDDMWDARAWVHLKLSFPNDNNGSRIMFTSRLADVALEAKPDNRPLFLRFLNEDESWDLFQRKAFQRESCPPELIKVGKQIAKRCQGLPLTIVIAAGVLANKEKTQDQWSQVGDTFKSSIMGDQQLCVETLALSYNHLPNHLKPCFLYFGAFPEDYEIRVEKLIWLWVAEGFIREIGAKILEDVAEEYLMDLIGRSLVTVSKRGSDGGIKSCHIHDLLRDFCLQKAEEEYFLQQISGHRSFSPMRRLFMNTMISNFVSLIPFASQPHSFLCISCGYIEPQPLNILCRCFNLLRVLDTSSMPTYSFPNDLEHLILLRYLALGSLLGSFTFDGYGLCIPASISKLSNLETLSLHTSSSVVLPHTIWKMVKLRHLHLSGLGIYKIQPPNVDDHYPSSLNSLHTLSCVDPLLWPCRGFLTRTPNLRKLGFRGGIFSMGCLTFPDTHFLNYLKKLKLLNTRRCISGWCTNLPSIRFPPNLKSLTLERTYLKWDDMSTLANLLPNLEVLKLLRDACRGSNWETIGYFPRLKFLKFHSMKLEEWSVSSDQFPSLERIVFSGCNELKMIPYEIGDIPTLLMIEVRVCSYSAARSAKEIKEEQESMGNRGLKIIIQGIYMVNADKHESVLLLETVDTDREDVYKYLYNSK